MKFFDFLKKKNARQYAKEGDEYCTKLEYKKALNSFEKAIKIEPNNDEYYAFRSFTKKHLGDIEGAIKDLDKAISLNPSCERYKNIKETFYKV